MTPLSYPDVVLSHTWPTPLNSCCLPLLILTLLTLHRGGSTFCLTLLILFVVCLVFCAMIFYIKATHLMGYRYRPEAMMAAPVPTPDPILSHHHHHHAEPPPPEFGWDGAGRDGEL